MRLLTLIAGYAAGLAVAMKYRKEAGTAKTPDPKASKMDNIIDEIVDIHKTAYTEVKGFVSTHLDDVKDFDSLKSKVMTSIDSFATEAESLISSLRSKGVEKGEKIKTAVDALYAEKNKLIDEAKTKGSSFADVAFDTLSGWIDEAKAKLTTAHSTIKAKIDTPTPIAKQPTPKKAPAKKSV